MESTNTICDSDGFAPFTSRRDFLGRAWGGIGALALSAMLAEEAQPAAKMANPLTPKQPHLKRKAKHCIFMFMAGGVSQMDTFDYCPALEEFAGQQVPDLPGLPRDLGGFNNLTVPHRIIPPVAPFKRYGQCGRQLTTLMPHLGRCVDDLAFIYGIETDNQNHGPATLGVNTGDIFPGSPSIGAWVNYGLGSPNQNLPGYVVIKDPRGAPMNGSAVWGNGYLPASYQGTIFRSSGSPILNLKPPEGLSRQQQRQELDVMKWLNEQHREERPDATELEARINAYELAFRMQAEAPEVVDLAGESPQTMKMYGLDNPVTAGFGRQCLLARRLVEQGVRYTLLVHGVENKNHSWDDHGNIQGLLPKHAAEVDQPVAALLRDLKQRGLFEETLVVWASEMGRTPHVMDLKSNTPGRDHNQFGLVMWMAGGDVKGAATAGETDGFGIRGIGEPIHIRDVQATILHLLGLDEDRLRYLHAGRLRQLTNIGGARLLSDIIA